jgi:hypothetical protein
MNTKVRRALDEPASTAPSKAPFQISTGVKASELWLKILLYGEFGSGKTVLAGQAADVPHMCDVLFIDVERGKTSLRGSDAVENFHNIDFIECKDFAKFDAIHQMLISYCQARDDDDQERLDRMAAKYGFDPTRRYRTVIIDSLSELNSISLQRAFSEDMDNLLSHADSDDTRRDYGRNKQSILKVVRAVRNLPMHIIMTCASEWDEDERKKLKHQPRLTGSLSKEIQAFWEVVGFLETKAARSEGEGGVEDVSVMRRLWLQPVGKFDAKNRLANQSVTHIDDPSMEKLISLLVGKKKKPVLQEEEQKQKPKLRK